MSRAKHATNILSFVDTETLRANVEEITLEDLRAEALRNREASGSVTETRSARSRRMTIMQQMGFDIKHVDDFEPHPDNFFSLDPEDIDNLAATIRETGRTRPITYRPRPNGQKDQIIGGERRWRAHKRNWELTGDEIWAMIPCENLGMLSDDEAMFHLITDNLANRILSESELARSIDIVGERIARRRKQEPAYAKQHEGRKTRDIVAEKFNISAASVTRLQSINRNLIDEGKRLLDRGRITKEQALSISKLDKEKQGQLITAIRDDSLNEKEVGWYIAQMQTDGTLPSRGDETVGPKKEKTVNDLLENAQKTLKKATKLKGKPDRVSIAQNRAMIAQIQAYLLELDEKLKETEDA